MTMLSNFEWWKFFFFFLLNICSISPLELDGVRNASYPLVWYAIANTRTFHSRNKQKIKDISTFLVKKKIILIVLSESDFRTKSLLLSHIRSHSCCAPRREIGINKLWFFTVTWQLQTHLHISVVAILLYGYYFFFFFIPVRTLNLDVRNILKWIKSEVCPRHHCRLFIRAWWCAPYTHTFGQLAKQFRKRKRKAQPSIEWSQTTIKKKKKTAKA